MIGPIVMTISPMNHGPRNRAAARPSRRQVRRRPGVPAGAGGRATAGVAGVAVIGRVSTTRGHSFPAGRAGGEAVDVPEAAGAAVDAPSAGAAWPAVVPSRGPGGAAVGRPAYGPGPGDPRTTRPVRRLTRAVARRASLSRSSMSTAGRPAAAGGVGNGGR